MASFNRGHDIVIHRQCHGVSSRVGLGYCGWQQGYCDKRGRGARGWGAPTRWTFQGRRCRRWKSNNRQSVLRKDSPSPPHRTHPRARIRWHCVAPEWPIMTLRARALLCIKISQACILLNRASSPVSTPVFRIASYRCCYGRRKYRPGRPAWPHHSTCRNTAWHCLISLTILLSSFKRLDFYSISSIGVLTRNI